MTTTTFFIIFIPVLSILLLTINLLLAPHFPYQEKDSAFECGFHSFLGQNRTQFSISFFIFGLLFLLFDLEIILVYPYSVSSYSNDAPGLIIVLIFFIVLTIGFIFELGKNALSIDSKQTSLPDNENTQTLEVFVKDIDMKKHAFIPLQSSMLDVKTILKIFTFIKQKFLILVLTTVISYTIRYLVIIYYELDLLDIMNHPVLSFFSIFGINSIRLIIRDALEQYMFFMNPAGGPQQGGVQGGQQGGQQVNQGGGQQTGGTPALIEGSPDIKPNGKYNTPPNMRYIPGGNNQPAGRILSKALEDYAIRNHHIDNNGNAATIQ